MPSKKIEVTCPRCKKIFLRNPHDIQKTEKTYGEWKCWLCSRKTRKQKTEKPIGFKRLHKQRQRILIKTESGWKDEHRFEMEKYLGRELEKDEIVHHIDGNSFNNKIENLELMLHNKHTIYHHTGKKRSKKTKYNISKSKRGKSISQKLTFNDVLNIRKSHCINKNSYSELAYKYNVSKGMIGHIIRKEAWR